MDKLAIFGGTPTISPSHTYSWPRLGPKHMDAVINLLMNDEISYYGTEGVLQKLESLWGSRLKLRTLGMSSGTAALHSAFFGLGAELGDEVICPTSTFLATCMPLVQLGAVPVLCEVENDTGNISAEGIAKAITSRTVGIVVTHLWGHPCEMDPIRELAEKYALWIVEDCSHAHGATYKGKEVGSLGDAAAFSFQAAKLVFAGQGGLLASRSDDVFERACLLGHFRVRAEQELRSGLRRYSETGFGLNYRMHPLGAALALESSQDMDEAIENRNRMLNRLSDGLRSIERLILPITHGNCTRGAYYGYKPRLNPEGIPVPLSAIITALQAEGLDVHRPGSRPLHLSAFFTDEDVPLWKKSKLPANRRRYLKGAFPIAESIWESSLSLPTFTNPNEEHLVDQYIKGFEKVFSQLEDLRSIDQSPMGATPHGQ